MKRVAFRMDDITPQMDWDRFDQFRVLFERENIKPLIGIVPDNHDATLQVGTTRDTFWQEMRQLVSQGWSVAQHGCNHVYETTDSGWLGVNARSEFASLPYDVQYQKIHRGQNLLNDQGIQSDIWMAPAHSYDRNTLRALKALGFRVVTDGYAFAPYDRMGLRCVPCQFGAPRMPPFGIATIAIHANTLSDKGFTAYERFVGQHRDVICDFADLTTIAPSNLVAMISEPLALAARRLKQVVTRQRSVD